MTHSSFLKTALAVGATAVIAASASSHAVAAPIGSGQLALKSAAPGYVVDAHRRRGHRTAAVVGGVAAGLFIGSLLAAPYYYGPPHPYPYAYAPYPPPAPFRCWIQTGPYYGQGYWAYC